MSETQIKSAIVTMIAETHIHSGVGQSIGALDLPVARERTTDYPFIPGSGVKGAFRVWATERANGLSVDNLFGQAISADKPDGGGDGFAGHLMCGDARVLLLPVRCLNDAYKWVTCPAILNRFQRDCKRAQQSCSMNITDPAQGKYFGTGEEKTRIGLEEREFGWAGAVDDGLITTLKNVVGPDLAGDMDTRLVVLSNTDFSWFARYALPVLARNVLSKDGNKKSKNLWYEESLAPDTIMYALFGQRKSGAVAKMMSAIQGAPYVQIGGNETIGQGWFKLSKYEGGVA